ncbi:MAG: T9SS type A sorting domain-containing protein [Flavobacteriales bacterium]
MRHALLLALILPILAQAQNWAPIGATWTYKQGQVASPDTNLAMITITGDTLIQGRNCAKLEATSGYYACYPFYDFIHYDGDSLWIYDQYDDRFMLLMCMNAMPGDAWTTELQHSNGGVRDTITWTVLDTATIVVDGTPLRSLDLSYASNGALSPYCWPHCTFIERIGNLKYLFDFQIGVCDAEIFQGLRCYEDNDISWQSPSVPQCALSTGISEWDDSSIISLSPNPVPAGAQVQVEITRQQGAVQLVVHDALGREVLRSDVRDERTVLSLPTSGSYLVRLLRDGTSVAQQRLVVR